MLIKAIFNGPDFEQSLRRRRLLAFALLTVGLVGTLCWFLLVQNSDLPDYAQGFYLGAASGMNLASVILLIRTQYLLSNPHAQKKARVQETDERQKAIISASFRCAGMVTFFTSAAALFVVLPLSRPAFFALMAVMALYAVSFLISNLILEKRM